MRSTCPPSWVELESVIPLEAEEGLSVEAVTSLSADTARREYSRFIVRVSTRRQGTKLKHALQIAGTVLDADHNHLKASA
jgi:hypothetical protein